MDDYPVSGSLPVIAAAPRSRKTDKQKLDHDAIDDYPECWSDESTNLVHSEPDPSNNSSEEQEHNFGKNASVIAADGTKGDLPLKVETGGESLKVFNFF